MTGPQLTVLNNGLGAQGLRIIANRFSIEGPHDNDPIYTRIPHSRNHMPQDRPAREQMHGLRLGGFHSLADACRQNDSRALHARLAPSATPLAPGR